MWEALLKRYWEVVLLKAGPENTPYSAFLLIIISFLFLILIVFQWYLADIKKVFDLGVALLEGITLLGSYFIYSYLLLKIYHKSNRAVQTLTTLLVSHTILHFFALPLLLLAPLLIAADINHMLALFIGIIYLICTFLLTAWQFLVTIHIYKMALEVDYLTAVLASFGLLACNIVAVSIWQ